MCYCGSAKQYKNCCQPIHKNPSKASTPEALMRSRFSAYCLGLVDYIINTYHPSCNAQSDRDGITEAAKTDWQKLLVKSSHVDADGLQGFVHFKAFYNQDRQSFCLEERSRFVKESGQWFYIDGELFD